MILSHPPCLPFQVAAMETERQDGVPHLGELPSWSLTGPCLGSVPGDNFVIS